MPGPGLFLACGLALAGCKSQPVQSPEAKAAQEQCPSSEHVLTDIKAMEGSVGALNSLSATPNTEDITRCTVEVQLGKGSVLWADGSLEYQKVEGAWELVSNKPSFQKTAEGHVASVELLTDETCACESEACLKDVVAKAARTLDVKRVVEIFREDPAFLQRVETRVEECQRRMRGEPSTSEEDKLGKSTKAKVNILLMAAGARMYFLKTASAGKAGTLPPSVGPTPLMGTCCGEACQVGADDWKDPTWVALDFVMPPPLFYSYEFEAGLTEDGRLRFTAIAHGDLDCDGKYSRFSVQGEAVASDIVFSEIVEENPLE
jgi:hypothetical protein